MTRLFHKLVISAVVALCFSYSFVRYSAAAQDNSAFRHVSIGDTIPRFELKTLDNKTVSSDSIKGNVAVLIFWKPGQKQSSRAAKELKSIYVKLREKGVQVLAITSSDVSQVRESLLETPLPFPVLTDRAREVYGSYGVIVTPTTAIVDATGKLRYYFPGYAYDYERAIEGNLRLTLGMISSAELGEFTHPKKTKGQYGVAKARRHLELASAFAKRSMIEEARSEYKQAIKLSPTLADAHIGLGFLLLKDKDLDDALREFDSALKKSPNSHEAKMGKAIVLAHKGDLTRAQKLLKQALVLNPDPARVHYELGKIYEQKRQVDEAMLEYKAALAKIFEDVE